MTQEKAESAVTTSALIVSGMYAYRKLTEKVIAEPATKGKKTPKQVATGVIGTGELLPMGSWITGFGVTFLMLSILASASPSVGGTFAILVAVGCTLGNGQAVFSDLKNSTNLGHSSLPSGAPSASAGVGDGPTSTSAIPSKVVTA